MHRSVRSLAVPVVAFALLTTACSDDEDPTTTTKAPEETTTSAGGSATTMDPNYGATSTTGAAATVVGIIQVTDQTGDGSSLIVDSVSLQGATGHIALHIDVDGTAGAVVGNAPVPEGITEDLEVPFDAPAASGTYWPMLHVDNGDGVYEFPGLDVPLQVDGKPVMMPVELTVE